MLKLNIVTDLWETFLDFVNPVVSFFKDLWNDINSFLLKYIPQDALNIIVVGVIIAIILVVVLAIVNNKD